MADSTRTINRRLPGRRVLVLAGSVLAVLLASAWLAGQARADGDPASDVLATQTLFLPQDARIPAAQQSQLAAILAAAHRGGYPLRVAIVASATDLGSVTELWGQPQSYARFLGQELSLVYGGPLLVVMPDGYGVYPAASSVLSGAGGAALGTAALTGIQRLAAASGHPLTLPRATALSKPSASDPLPWLVFAAGIVLMLAAWSASLRARPLGGRRTEPSST